MDIGEWREVIQATAKNGEVIVSWDLLKRLICLQFYNVMEMFLEDKENPIPVVDGESYETRYKRIQAIISKWERPPFTTQRLCELLSDPKRSYKVGAKFLMAFSKSVYGVTARPIADSLLLPKDDEDMLYFDEEGNPIVIVDEFDDIEFEGGAGGGGLVSMTGVGGSRSSVTPVPPGGPGTPRPVPRDTIELIMGQPKE